MNRAPEKILLTGMGVKGPGVASPADLWDRLTREKAPRPVRARRLPGGGDIIGFVADDVDADPPSKLERLAIAACEDALADADLPAASLEQAGVYVGTTYGTIDLFEEETAAGRGPEPTQLYGVSGLLADRFGCMGPNQVFSTACSASLNAIGLAAEAMRNGSADVMIVGGVEILSVIALSCFTRLGGLDTEYCRPFDRNRKGAVFGEGAGFLVLETEGHWRSRGANPRPYCTIDGFGWSCDAHHATAPEPTGAALIAAAEDALARAGGSVDEIGCVVPHGTGTDLNDAVEARMLQELLREGRQDAPILPLKASVGHGGGAAGVFGCIAAALICRHQSVPAAVNCDDPEFDLNFSGQSRGAAPIERVLVNSYAFGGNNASLLIGAL